MTVSTFREMYLKEPQGALSVEAQLVDALPRMKKAATNEKLKQALEHHFDETRPQLDQVNGAERSGEAGHRHRGGAPSQIRPLLQ